MGYFTPIKIELTDDWVTPEEYHARQKPAQEEEDKGSNLGRGLKSGVLSTLAIPPALASMGVKTLGLQGAAEWSAEKASGLLEKASEYQPDTSFKELVSDPSWEGALDWGLYTIGNIAPSMIVGMGGAGLGGKIAAKVFLKKAIKKEALKGLTLKKATETAVKKIVGAGQKTGLVASTGAMEGGHMYMTDVEKHGVEGARVAPHLLAGTVAGLIELGLGGAEISMINKYLGKGAAKIASKDPSAGVKMLNKIWQVAKVPAGEATQELLQEEIAMLDEIFVAKPGEEVTTPFSKEGLWRGAESAASGLMGGVPGAAGVAVTPIRKGISKGIEDRARRDETIVETEDAMADMSARLNDPEDRVVNIGSVIKEYQRLADDENMVNERAAIGNMAFNYIMENKVDDAVKADIVKKLGEGDPLGAKIKETISEMETVEADVADEKDETLTNFDEYGDPIKVDDEIEADKPATPLVTPKSKLQTRAEERQAQIDRTNLEAEAEIDSNARAKAEALVKVQKSMESFRTDANKKQAIENEEATFKEWSRKAKDKYWAVELSEDEMFEQWEKLAKKPKPQAMIMSDRPRAKTEKQRTIEQIEADIAKRQEIIKKHVYKAGDVRKSQLAHELSVLYHEMETAAKAEAGKRAAPERGIKGKDEPFKLPETLKNKVVYNGIQEGFGKIPARHTFTDKNTGSTFLIGLDETDIESKVNERLDELDADFKEKEVVEPQAEKIKDVETKEIPLEKIKYSKELPQFKEGADAKGVVEPLRGKYERVGTPPIILWERKNGDLEIMTGRHRYQLALEQGEETIPAQFLKEADGFTAEQAAILDVESNIRDEKGSVRDYATYFKETGITEKQATDRGLLSRVKGKNGFTIGKYASDDLYAAYRNKDLNEKKVVTIAKAVPNNKDLQSVGAKYAMTNSAEDTKNYLQVVKTITSKATGKQVSLFGENESWQIEADKMAKVASGMVQNSKQERNLLKSAGKLDKKEHKKFLDKYGIKAGDTEAVNKRIVELDKKIRKLDNWAAYPDVVADIKKQAGIEEKKPDKSKPFKQPWETSDLSVSPNIGIASVQAQKQLNGKYKLFFGGTRNEVFQGEEFRTVQEARTFFKVQKIKAQEAVGPKKKPEAKTDESQVEEAKDENVKFETAEEDENLAIVHNLSINNLKHAIKMGGLPTPSVAVIDVEKTDFKRFGEITLIASRENLGPGTRGSKFFNADIYSPRYPSVTHVLDAASKKKITEYFDSLWSEVEHPKDGKHFAAFDIGETEKIKDKGIDRYFEEGSTLLHYGFLKDIGRLPKRIQRTYAGRQKIDTAKRKIPRKKYLKWVETKKQELDLFTDEKIFNGFTYSGTKKYLKHDLDTVVRLLKKKLKDGEGFNYGVPSIRAKSALQFKSVKQMQLHRDKIISTEDMDVVKKEVEAGFDSIANDAIGYLKYKRGLGDYDSFSEHIKEAIDNHNFNTVFGDKSAYYHSGVDVTAIVDFVNKLRHLPTEYFEGKIQRAVGLSEFEAAVIPKNTPKEIKEWLKNNNIKISLYEESDPKARAGKIKKMARQKKVLFETAQKNKARPLTRADIKKAFSKMSNVATGIDKQGNFWFRFKGFPRFTIHEMDSINDRVGITDERQRTGAFLDKSKQLWFKTGGVGAQADIGSLYHEQFHLLRKFGVVSRADTNAIKRAIRRGGHKGTITEETEASWIGDAAKSREYARDTVIGRIIQKIGDFIDSMVNLLMTTSRGVSRKMESGKMAEQQSLLGREGKATPAMAFETMAKEFGVSVKQLRKEFEETKAKYEDTDKWLKAPNGKKSNLNEHLWVMTRTPRFKEWFGGSKVLDANGDPLVVYHGTSSKFTKFNRQHDKNYPEDVSDGFYFTSNTEHASQWRNAGIGGNIIPVFLSAKNVAIKNYAGEYWDSDNYVINAEKTKKDGAIRKNMKSRATEIIFDEYVVFNPNQIKSIYNTGAYSKDDADISFEQTAERFYSQVIKTVETKMPKKMQASAVLNWLKKQPGVKAAELEWMNIEEMLEGKKSVGRDELVGLLRENQVVVEEVERKDTTAYSDEQINDTIEFLELDDYTIKEEQDSFSPESIYRVYSDKFSLENEEFENQTEAESAAQVEASKQAIQYLEQNEEKPTDTKFSGYQLEGKKENYRELLFRLPPQYKGEQDTTGWTAHTDSYAGRAKYVVKDSLGNVIGEYFAYDGQEAIDIAAGRVAREYKQESFQSSHWDETNVFAHIRVRDEVDVEDNKVLFVEESQPEWAKALMDEFDTFKKEKYPQLTKLEKGKERTILEKEAKKEFVDLKKKDEYGTVPFMPLWDNAQEVIWKRIIRMAAEQGFDKVSWISGQQTADRYDLSKQVSQMMYRKLDAEGKYNFDVYGNDGQVIIHRTNIDLKTIEDFVGKEITQKIKEGKGEKDEVGWQTLSGLDLKIGGKWAFNLYDKMIPQYLKKFGKKYKAQVGTTEINGNEQQTFTITPQLKQAALSEGMPLFESKVTDGSGTSFSVERIKKETREVKSLTTEALKYETAEEFVDAQEKVYHGGAGVEALEKKFDILTPEQKQKLPSSAVGLTGLSMTPNKKIALDYSTNIGQTDKIFEAYINPNAKILKIDTKGEGIDEFYTDNKINDLTKKGYDAIQDISKVAESEYRVLTPKAIKTKAQLIDIWNKAQEKENILFETKELDPFAASPDKVAETVSGIINNLKKSRLGKRFSSEVVSVKDMNLWHKALETPYVLAKKFPAMEKALRTEIRRHENRSQKMFDYYHGDLDKLQTYMRKHPKDLKALEDLTWEWEDKRMPEDEVPTNWYSIQENIDKGETYGDLIINPEHYAEVKKFLLKQGHKENVVDGFITRRKVLDEILIEADEKMRSSNVDLTDLQEFRAHIGKTNNYFPHVREGDSYIRVYDKNTKKVVYREHFYKLKERFLKPENKARQRTKRWVKEQIKSGKLEGKESDYRVGQARTVEQLPDEVYFQIPVEALDQLSKQGGRVLAAEKVSREAKRLMKIEGLSEKDAHEKAYKLLTADMEKALAKAFSDVLKTRGWGSHAIKRMGVEGYKKDETFRIMFQYLSGYAGFSTKIDAVKEHHETLHDIDAKSKPKLYKYTSDYIRDMTANADKVDNAVDKVRAALFVKFLGGVIKSGLVNLTQNVVMAAPVLSQYTKKSHRKLAKAMYDTRKAVTGKDAWLGKETDYEGIPANELRALHEMVESGAAQDLFLRELKGRVPTSGMGAMVNKVLNKAGIFMQIAEKFNRASTGLAAYRIAMNEGATYDGRKTKNNHDLSVRFAKKAIYDSHFLYGKSNLPAAFRGGDFRKVAKAAYTFRSFTHNYLDIMSDMLLNQGTAGKKVVARSLMNIFAVGGLVSVPFFKAFSEMLKYVTDDDDEDLLTQLRAKMPNKFMQDLLVYGIPGATMGVDVSGSLSIEVPRNFKDIIGVPYSFGQDTVNMVKSVKAGNMYRAVAETPFTPIVIRNAMRGIDLYARGQTTRAGKEISAPGEKGARKITGFEAIKKSIGGLQPVSVSSGYKAYRASTKMKQGITKRKRALVDRFINARRRNDGKELQKIRREINVWNKKAYHEKKPWRVIDVDKMIEYRLKDKGLRNFPKRMRGQAKDIYETWK